MNQSLVQRHSEQIRLTPSVRTGDVDNRLVGQSAPIMAAMNKQMRRAQMGASQGIQSQFFSPFRTRPSLETPTKRVDLNEWYRYYFKHDPYVGTSIELHATYPLSGFELEHEDKALEQMFNEEKDALGLDSLFRRMGMEYWIVGEAFPFGFLDDPEKPQRWERFILLDPDKVKINKHQMAVGKHDRDYFIRLEPDADLKKIVNNGPNHPNTGPLYRNIPIDVIESVKAGKSIPLHPLQASHFKREVNPFNVRGESVISRVIQDLMYLDKLRDAQYAIADRHVTPKEFYMIGEAGNEADAAELQDFHNALMSTYHGYNSAIVWHHALKVQWEGATGRILPLKPEFDYIEKRLLSGLMMSAAFMHGEGPTFANASVALDILIARYMQYREKLEGWCVDHVFDPLCRMNEIYKPTTAEIEHRVRIRQPNKKPWVPKVRWERGALRDDQFKVNLFKELVEKNYLPRIDLYRVLNKDIKQVKQELATQSKDDKEMRKNGDPIPGQMQAPGGLPGGMPPPPPGGAGAGGKPTLPGAGLPPNAPKLPSLPQGTEGEVGAGTGPAMPAVAPGV
jgi:hypothetical protein